jgi:ubiquinone/menaquinone biosynthesis C-methylase UbiE
MIEPWRRASTYAGGPSILSSRSLPTAYRRLAEVLRPGLRVLDVGCGPGVITRGIAERIGPGGRVVGIDLVQRLVEEARRTHGDVDGLTFEMCDVYALPYREEFDIVTAARVLQWLSRPLDAVRMMFGATKPGGVVMVLDYNHRRTRHTPEPPVAMRVFHAAFLRWRAQAGLDNEITDHLAGMFTSVGLRDVVEIPQSEVSCRGDQDFEVRAGIWADTAAFHGPRMVEDGVVTEQERAAAEADYRHWVAAEAQSQTLYLTSVEGFRPL